MSIAIQRALLLQSQGRHGDAERELRASIADDPDNAYAHAMLALCLAEQKRYVEASDQATAAVGLAPELPFAYYVRAKVLYDRNRYDESLEAIGQAIEREPFDANYHGFQAAIHLEKGQWALALESAELGLEADPDHDVCTDLRTRSLVKLGRRDEASATIEGALQRNPEDPFAHANLGWAMLNRSEPTPALEHFLEALRLKPTAPWARAGLVDALQAKSVVYRGLLAYFLWMSRLTTRGQWFVIIGLFVVYQLLTRVAMSYPAVAPFILPVLGIYVGLMLVTWLGEPLFNSLLRLHPIGRHALSRDERNVSTAVLLLAGVALLLVIVRFVFDVPHATLGSFACLMLMLPTVGVFRSPPGWPRNIMATVTLLLALSGAVSATLLAMLPDGPIFIADIPPLFQFARGLSVVFILGIAASSVGANLLSTVKPKR